VKYIWEKNGKGVVPIALYGNITEKPQIISKEVAIRYVEKLTELTILHGFSNKYFEGSLKEKESLNNILDYFCEYYLGPYFKRNK